MNGRPSRPKTPSTKDKEREDVRTWGRQDVTPGFCVPTSLRPNVPTSRHPSFCDHDPHFFEELLFKQGIRVIAGVDEVGRGCLAGPVVAAAVVLPRGLKIHGLKDSKQLTRAQRERFYGVICEKAIAYATGELSPKEIDQLNILEASLKAMRIAVDSLSVTPDYLLIDGHYGIRHKIPQKPIKKGDVFSMSIAAASVIAKVTRDRLMCDFEREYPSFKFSIHKGYGTARHLAEIRQNGPTPIHRMTFRGVS